MIKINNTENLNDAITSTISIDLINKVLNKEIVISDVMQILNNCNLCVLRHTTSEDLFEKIISENKELVTDLCLSINKTIRESNKEIGLIDVLVINSFINSYIFENYMYKNI